ncbi:MAG: hypothetical protein NVS3B25_07400 [Hymenobacter sp.]
MGGVGGLTGSPVLVGLPGEGVEAVHQAGHFQAGVALALHGKQDFVEHQVVFGRHLGVLLNGAHQQLHLAFDLTNFHRQRLLPRFHAGHPLAQLLNVLVEFGGRQGGHVGLGRQFGGHGGRLARAGERGRTILRKIQRL